MVCLSETWASDVSISDSLLSYNGTYTVYRSDRLGSRGGGVAFLVDSTIPSTLLSSLSHSIYCQSLSILVSPPCSPPITLHTVYRSPSCHISSFDKCLEELSSLLCSQSHPAIFLGDLNCPDISWPRDRTSPSSHPLSPHSQTLLHFTDSFDFDQHVLSATRGRNILDLVFSTDSSIVSDVTVESPFPGSDHSSVSFYLPLTKPSPAPLPPTLDYKRGNFTAIQTALNNIDWLNLLTSSTDMNLCYSRFLAVIHSYSRLYSYPRSTDETPPPSPLRE